MTDLTPLEIYKNQEFEKLDTLRSKFSSLDELANVSLTELYPEFALAKSEIVGVFNPFTTGKFDNLPRIGQGSSVLTLLPFYEKVIVCVERVPEEYFREFYGVDISELSELVEAGRVLPLLPPVANTFMLFGNQSLEYLQVLFRRNWPSSDRAFRLSQHVTLETLRRDEVSAQVIAKFTEIMLSAGREIFGDVSGGASLLNFVKLCNRAIYRGDYLLVLTWIDLAVQYKRLFMSLEPTLWDILTLSILDFRDYVFVMSLMAPGGSSNYSSTAFAWLASELNTKAERSRELGMPQLNEQRFVLNQAAAANGAWLIDDIIVLRKGFVVEPIDAVGDMRKYIHWLEHSANIAQNQQMLRLFSARLRRGQYKDAVADVVSSADEIIRELNHETSKVSFAMRTTQVMLQAGATVGAALAGAALGNAVAAGDLASLFAMCGAVAATKLTESLADDVATKVGGLIFRSNPAFLIWQQKHEPK